MKTGPPEPDNFESHNPMAPIPANSKTDQFFALLPVRSRAIVLLAVFALFAPLSVLIVSRVGEGWTWFDITGWFIGNGIIAIAWAYFFFIGRHYWVPPIVTVVMSFAFSFYFNYSVGATNSQPTPISILSVALIIIGYIGFVVFISREGSRTIHLQTEIELAREIHQHIVPGIDMSTDIAQVYGRSESSSEIGGDLMDAASQNDRLYVTVADVSGHGVRAGVLMAMIKSAIETKMVQGEAEDRFMEDVNNVVTKIKRPDMFATMARVSIDRAGTVFFGGAGHTPVLHVDANTGKASELLSQGPPVGVVPELKFETTRLSAKPGDIFVILTDGLTEVANKTGEHLGIERITEIVTHSRKSPLNSMYDEIMAAVHDHGPQDDDQTLVLIRIGDGRAKSS